MLARMSTSVSIAGFACRIRLRALRRYRPDDESGSWRQSWISAQAGRPYSAVAWGVAPRRLTRRPISLTIIAVIKLTPSRGARRQPQARHRPGV